MYVNMLNMLVNTPDNMLGKMLVNTLSNLLGNMLGNLLGNMLGIMLGNKAGNWVIGCAIVPPDWTSQSAS